MSLNLEELGGGDPWCDMPALDFNLIVKYNWSHKSRCCKCSIKQTLTQDTHSVLNLKYNNNLKIIRILILTLHIHKSSSDNHFDNPEFYFTYFIQYLLLEHNLTLSKDIFFYHGWWWIRST